MTTCDRGDYIMRRKRMTYEEAKSVKRPTIRVGRRYTFYSEVQQEYLPPAERLRNYTGQRVLVIEQTFYPGHPDWCPGESERSYLVRADDGREFGVHMSELNGWDYDLCQYFSPESRSPGVMS